MEAACSRFLCPLASLPTTVFHRVPEHLSLLLYMPQKIPHLVSIRRKSPRTHPESALKTISRILTARAPIERTSKAHLPSCFSMSAFNCHDAPAQRHYPLVHYPDLQHRVELFFHPVDRSPFGLYCLSHLCRHLHPGKGSTEELTQTRGRGTGSSVGLGPAMRARGAPLLGTKGEDTSSGSDSWF